MIIKNSKEIRKIYVGSTPTPSLNYNNSRVFRYVVDEYVPPVYTCPDVVQTMDGYDGNAKEVYAKDTEKWYMRNNLGNYEEYGILEEVQSLASATFYEGKLVIFGNHEYESVGGNWVDLGAAQGTTKKIKSPSYIYNDSSHLFSIPVGYTASTDTKFIMKIRPTDNGGGAILGDNDGTSDQTDYRVFLYSGNFYFDAPGSSAYGNRIYGGSFLNQDSELEFGNFYIKNLKTGSNVVTGTPFTYQRTSTLILGESNQYGHIATDKFQLSALTMYHGDTLERDFIPAIDGNDICLYDKVSDAYFKSDNGKMPLSGGTITEVEVGTISYPKDYDQKDAPANNVTVESLDQIECPYDGMTAYVNGVKYTYENGEWIEHTETDWSQEYLTFEALESTKFRYAMGGTNADMYYSLDGGDTWVGLGSLIDTPTVNAGDTIMFKRTKGGESGYAIYINFISSGAFNVMGNPVSILKGDNFATTTSITDDIYALQRLFSGCTHLVSAENLSLQQLTSFRQNIFKEMFKGCTSLTTPPKLPGIVSEACFNGMFEGCTSLTIAPELPATTLIKECYQRMFYNCTALTTAPELPATTLAQRCYINMFYGCTSLTTAPELPAATLTDYCYYSMFEQCTSLNYIKMLATNISASACLSRWVAYAPSSGTFVKNASMTTLPTGPSGIPAGWTVEDATD